MNKSKIKIEKTSEIASILQDYSYAMFCEEEIDRALEKLSINDFERNFRSNLDLILSEKVKNSFDVLDRFINDNIKVHDEIIENINELYKVASFFDRVHFGEDVCKYFNYVSTNKTIFELVKRVYFFKGRIKSNVRELIKVYKIVSSRINSSDRDIFNSDNFKEVLFNKYKSIVDDVLGSMKVKSQDLEDIKQEGYLAVINAINEYDIKCGYDVFKYINWYVRKSLSNLDMEHKKTFVKLDESNVTDDDMESNLVLEDFRVRFDKFLINSKVSLIDLKLVLMFSKGYNYKEISKMLGINSADVGDRINNTLDILRNEKDVLEFVQYLDNPNLVFDNNILNKEELVRDVSNDLDYVIYDLYYTLESKGYSSQEISDALDKMDRKSKLIFYDVIGKDLKKFRRIRPLPSEVESEYLNAVLILKRIIDDSKNVSNNFSCELEIHRDKILFDVYKIMGEHGFNVHEIRAGLLQISPERIEALNKFSGGDLENPKEVSVGIINFSVLRLSLKRLEEKLNENRNVVNIERNINIQNNLLYRKALRILINLNLDVPVMYQREVICYILSSGMVDGVRYDMDKISDVVGVSKRFIKNAITRYSDEFEMKRSL